MYALKTCREISAWRILAISSPGMSAPPPPTSTHQHHLLVLPPHTARRRHILMHLLLARIGVNMFPTNPYMTRKLKVFHVPYGTRVRAEEMTALMGSYLIGSPICAATEQNATLERMYTGNHLEGGRKGTVKRLLRLGKGRRVFNQGVWQEGSAHPVHLFPCMFTKSSYI